MNTIDVINFFKVKKPTQSTYRFLLSIMHDGLYLHFNSADAINYVKSNPDSLNKIEDKIKAKIIPLGIDDICVLYYE